MNRFPNLKKTLSLVVVAMLLSLRLGSLTEEVFTTPIEEALFDVVFIAEDNPLEGKVIKAEQNPPFEIPVNPSYIKFIVIDKLGLNYSPFVSDLIFKDILSKIFIPPELLS